MSAESAPPLDLDQNQPPVRPHGDGISAHERHARLLAALRALLELPPTRDHKTET
jgi:hypothetical protein